MDTIVRYSSRALPVRRYVLGVGARPSSEPPEPPRKIEPAAYEAEWRYGIDLFNYAYFWEAHEAWEAIWASSREEPERTIIQGFIQFAAALLQLERAQRETLRLDAVHGLALRGVAKIRLGAAQCTSFRGLPLRKLMPEFETFLKRLETAGPRDLATLEPPRLELAIADATLSAGGKLSLKDIAAKSAASAASAAVTPTSAVASSGSTAPSASAASAASAAPVKPPAPAVVATGELGELLEGVTLEPLSADASEEDRRALGLLLRDVVEGGTVVGFSQPLSVGVAADYWTEVLNEVAAGTRIVILARLEKIIVGAVQLALCSQPSGKHRAELQKLMVLRTRWRSGIGRAIMQAAEAAAKAKGRGLLVLDARVGDPSEQLYERAGYIRVGAIPAYVTNDNGGYDSVVFFYKHLARR